MEVYDNIQTIHHTIVGLRTTVTEKGACPWKDLSSGELLDAIAILGELAPRIKQVIEDRLAATGHDPDTGKKQWWGRVFMDRAREAVISAFFAFLAGGIIGLFAWGQFFGGKSSLMKAQLDARQELVHKLEALESQAASDRLERDALREALRRPTPAQQHRTYPSR